MLCYSLPTGGDGLGLRALGEDERPTRLTIQKLKSQETDRIEINAKMRLLIFYFIFFVLERRKPMQNKSSQTYLHVDNLLRVKVGSADYKASKGNCRL